MVAFLNDLRRVEFAVAQERPQTLVHIRPAPVRCSRVPVEGDRTSGTHRRPLLAPDTSPGTEQGMFLLSACIAPSESSERCGASRCFSRKAVRSAVRVLAFSPAGCSAASSIPALAAFLITSVRSAALAASALNRLNAAEGSLPSFV